MCFILEASISALACGDCHRLTSALVSTCSFRAKALSSSHHHVTSLLGCQRLQQTYHMPPPPPPPPPAALMHFLCVNVHVCTKRASSCASATPGAHFAQILGDYAGAEYCARMQLERSSGQGTRGCQVDSHCVFYCHRLPCVETPSCTHGLTFTAFRL